MLSEYVAPRIVLITSSRALSEGAYRLTVRTRDTRPDTLFAEDFTVVWR
jgi:hypothetical protein